LIFYSLLPTLNISYSIATYQTSVPDCFYRALYRALVQSGLARHHARQPNQGPWKAACDVICFSNHFVLVNVWIWKSFVPPGANALLTARSDPEPGRPRFIHQGLTYDAL
jgi:hypothetical protein